MTTKPTPAVLAFVVGIALALAVVAAVLLTRGSDGGPDTRPEPGTTPTATATDTGALYGEILPMPPTPGPGTGTAPQAPGTTPSATAPTTPRRDWSTPQGATPGGAKWPTLNDEPGAPRWTPFGDAGTVDEHGTYHPPTK